MAATSPRADVYLLPAIVGGGVGDIEEVLAAGRRLARAGFPITVFRRSQRPLPPGVEGPWSWPRHARTSVLSCRSPRALTIAPAWGITAAPASPGRLGRPGPWAEEAAEIERRYGSERTVHVSLEEFARTLTSREETVERLREGGVRAREVAAGLAAARSSGDVRAFHDAFRRFRAFDRGNVLHLFAGFLYARPFAKEFPEAVQTGPLWSGLPPPSEKARRRARPGPAGRAPRSWVWYASPASSRAIAPAVVAGLRRGARPTRLLVRTPRAWDGLGRDRRLAVEPGPLSPPAWRRTFSSADLRIVTGSRSLLEALEVGGPFLYFNGVLGTGRVRRRHRPEKIVQLLELAREERWPADLVRDLEAFSRGQRVTEVVARAVGRHGGWDAFPPAPRPRGFASGFEDAGTVLVRVARDLAAGRVTSYEAVRDARGRSRP